MQRVVVIDGLNKKAWAFTDPAMAEAKLRELIGQELDLEHAYFPHPQDPTKYLTSAEVGLIPSKGIDEVGTNVFRAQEGEDGAWAGYDTAQRQMVGGPLPDVEENIRWDGYMEFLTGSMPDGQEVGGVEK